MCLLIRAQLVPEFATISLRKELRDRDMTLWSGIFNVLIRHCQPEGGRAVVEIAKRGSSPRLCVKFSHCRITAHQVRHVVMVVGPSDGNGFVTLTGSHNLKAPDQVLFRDVSEYRWINCLICFISYNCHCFVLEPINQVSIQRNGVHHGPENLAISDKKHVCGLIQFRNCYNMRYYQRHHESWS